jgi:hypothetical protein
MRQLMTVLIFIAGTSLTLAKEAAEVRPAAPPKDPPKSSVTTPDKLLLPKGVRAKAPGKSVETIIPDICKGC